MRSRNNSRLNTHLLSGHGRDALALLCLCAVVLGCFWRLALANRVLASGDVFTYFYPYWAEATRAIRSGRLPLWNPYLFMGAPLLANSQVGTLYPLNWPLWLLFPAHRSVHLTLVLHLCLAAVNAYLWGRFSLRLRRASAWVVGAVFALSGYLGAQVEHVNQLQGLAWLPLLLMLSHRSYDGNARSEWPRPRPAFAGLAIVVSLILLAGHTQTAFISLVGLSAYSLGPVLWRGLRHGKWRPLVHRALVLTGATVLGVTLAAVQLIPTWELSRQSIRAGGLSYQDRVSFSLSPFYLSRALLPAFVESVEPEHIEHVAYLGIMGLALAAAALGDLRDSPSCRRPVIILVTTGLFLSFGYYNPVYLLLARFVPGFAHFRVPARWLALYTLGMGAAVGSGADALLRQRARLSRRSIVAFAAVMAALVAWAMIGVRVGEVGQVGWATVVGWIAATVSAVGLLILGRYKPRPAAVGLIVFLVIELTAASSALPHARATAPQAFTSLRPAIAHLLTRESGRYLSMSDLTFDPGDLPEIGIIYGPQLTSKELYDYVIATKHKEVLSPNLPLAFGVPAVDGYGGGVLPLARYVTFERLFITEDPVSMDGRLREGLATIPDGRWLNLLNVRHIITDKLRDAWLDNIFYDLQFGARLAQGESAEVLYVAPLEGTALGIVSHLQGASALPDGAVVGTVEIGFLEQVTRTFELRAGEQTAEGEHDPHVAHARPEEGAHSWPGQPGNLDYVTRLRWQQPETPVSIVVRATLPVGELVLRAMSVIDERTGGFQSLVISDQGHYRLAHSGDVKVYENLDALPRAFLVPRAIVAADDETALTLMQDEAFDPALVVVLAESNGLVPAGDDSNLSLDGPPQPVGGTARLASYSPERVEIEIEADTDGYLVLSDAWYPGWDATLDGEPVRIRRADVLFRAIAVDAGSHRVAFSFRPSSLRLGAGVSLAGLAVLLAVTMKSVRVRSAKHRLPQPPC